jgi:ribosomal protein S18 acetylase RimI-like enzyme
MDPWISAFERMSARHWQGTEQAHLGGWLLRAAGGFTGRANSALPLGEPGMPTERAVDEVEAWYRRRGLKPMIVIATGLGADGNALDHLLERRGWPRRRAPALVMTTSTDVVSGRSRPAAPSRLAGPNRVATASTAEVSGPAAEPARTAGPAPHAPPPRDTAPASGDELVFADEPDEDWLAAYRYQGQRLPPDALPVLLSAPVQVFASVRRDGRTIATGRLSLAGGWGGLTAIEVDPACRRGGLGTAVTAGLAAQAAARGAERIFLQVELDNTAARALYVRCGFAGRHRYHYRTAPQR